MIKKKSLRTGAIGSPKKDVDKGRVGIKTHTGSSRTSVRKIGNSKGIILSNNILSGLHLDEGSEVELLLEAGFIKIVPVPQARSINKDLSSWDNQFKTALKKGQAPDGDLFDGIENEFDHIEWK